jgi:hypothetical protein
MSIAVWEQVEQIRWTQCLLNSYRHWLGRDLLDASQLQADPAEQAKSLFLAPFVVVSHGTEADPILNYGNQTALDLWEMDWQTLTRTPSRFTAEVSHRTKRAEVLAQLSSQGFIEHYRGVRISSTGKRFWIEDTVIWNLIDDQGIPCGQAATFCHWTPILEENAKRHQN